MDKKCEKSSVYTVLYWLLKDSKIEPKNLFDFLEFFWPKFKKKNGYVFLKEKYSEQEFDRLIKEKSNPEYWINLLMVDEFFTESEEKGKSIALAKALAEIWGAKLKKDFPELSFTVKCLHNKQFGDFGLTFYQTDKLYDSKIIEESKKIASPNMKENKLEQFHSGPRPGIPQIRKPTSSEIPK